MPDSYTQLVAAVRLDEFVKRHSETSEATKYDPDTGKPYVQRRKEAWFTVGNLEKKFFFLDDVIDFLECLVNGKVETPWGKGSVELGSFDNYDSGEDDEALGTRYFGVDLLTVGADCETPYAEINPGDLELAAGKVSEVLSEALRQTVQCKVYLVGYCS